VPWDNESHAVRSEEAREAVSEQEARLSADVERLRRHVEKLETRIEDIEARLDVATRAAVAPRPGAEPYGAPGSTAIAIPDVSAGEAADEAEEPGWAAGLPVLVGRGIMAFGGAFLLRALTERGAMPQTAGVAVGLAYALLWTFMADRAARADRKLDATLYGLVTAMIAFPLIAETSARFAVLWAPLAALTLTAVGAVVLWVAWRHGLGPLAWIVTLASTGTGVVLLFATHALPSFTAALFALATASLATSYHRDWYGLRWPAALSLDVLVLLSMYLAGKPNYEWLRPGAVATVQLLLTAMYLGIIGVRTLILRNPMREFGVIQSLLVLVVGLEGARWMLGPDFAGAAAFPLAALALATGSWLVAFYRLENDPTQRANFNWYVTLGTLLVVYGLRLAVLGQIVGLIWASIALVAARFGMREDRVVVRWNVAALAVAAAFGSGLARAAFEAFIGADPAKWLTFPAEAWVTSIVCLAGWGVSRWSATAREEPFGRTVPGLALLVVAAIGLGTAVVSVAGLSIAGLGTADHDVAALAVLRTAVLVTASLLLAASTRLRPRAELVWMTYAVLALCACKIAIEDLPNGRAMTMFLSFVLFGGALIAAPQLLPQRNHKKGNRNGAASRSVPAA